MTGRKKPFVSRKRPARVRAVTYVPARRTTPSSKSHASGGDGGGPGAGGAGGGGGGGALHDADPSWVSCNCLTTIDGCRPTAATASAAGTTSTATTGAIAPPPPNAGHCESAAVNPKEVNDCDHDDHDHDDGEEEDKSTGTGRTDCCNTEARPTGAGALSITSTWSRAGYEPTITLVNGEFIATAPGELHEPLRSGLVEWSHSLRTPQTPLSVRWHNRSFRFWRLCTDKSRFARAPTPGTAAAAAAASATAVAEQPRRRGSYPPQRPYSAPSYQSEE